MYRNHNMQFRSKLDLPELESKIFDRNWNSWRQGIFHMDCCFILFLGGGGGGQGAGGEKGGRLLRLLGVHKQICSNLKIHLGLSIKDVRSHG